MAHRPEDLERMAALGLLAGATAQGLAEPLARVKAALAEACDLIDRHIALSRGPDPLPRQQTSRVRETIADAFMDVSRCARLAADLAALVTPSVDPGPIDVNDTVQRAVALAGSPLSGECDLRLDLGFVPPVQGDAARLAQVIAHILLHAVDEAQGGGITVRTVEEETGVLIEIVRPTGSQRHFAFEALVRDTIAALGGTLAKHEMGERIRVVIGLPR